MTAQLCKSLFRGLRMHAFLFTFFSSALIISSSISTGGGSICIQHCQEYSDRECLNRTVKELECGDRGALINTCGCCLECAKLEGETCHGAHGLVAGRCREDLKCTVPLQFVESGANITGTCKLPRMGGDSCGGAYGHLGRCHDDFSCGVPYHEVDYAELMNGVNISGICVSKSRCLRNCSRKTLKPKCASDGRWYRNLCAFRQKKCFLIEEEQKNFSMENSIVCDTACQEVPVPDHAEVVLSNGVRNGSVATFSCAPGYVLGPGAGTLTCQSQQWQGTPPTCYSNPCLNVHCGRGAKCIAATNSSHECVCKSQSECRLEPEPVCGSDNRTYSSQCHLDAQYCRSGSLLYTVHTGVCEGSTVPPSTEASDRDFFP